MPPEMNDLHARLGQHGATLEGHRRELDGLWGNDEKRRQDIDEQRDQLTKVRVQMAVILAAGAAFFALVQAIVAKFTIEAITRAMGGQ